MRLRNKYIIAYNDINKFDFYNYSKFVNYNFKNIEEGFKHYIKYGFNLFNKPNIECNKKFIYTQNEQYSKNRISFILIYDENNSIDDLNTFLNRIESLYYFVYEFEIILININPENKEILLKLKTNLFIRELFGEDFTNLLNIAKSKINSDIVLLQNINVLHNHDFLKIIFNNIDSDTLLDFCLNKDLSRPIKNFCFTLSRDNLDLINIKYKNLENFEINDLLIQLKYNLKLEYALEKNNLTFLKNIICNSSNKKINELLSYHTKSKYNFPKIMFLYWDESKLSYLNYLTIKSFNKYNKGWQIIIYKPTKYTKEKKWNTPEQKKEYTGKCYFNELNHINNVTIKKIDFNLIGFDNEYCEVVKSDYLRYYLLNKYGGLWSDFDILYIKNIETIITNNKNIFFHCHNKIKNYNYYPIGLLISKRNNKIMNYLISKCKEYYKETYQCIGTDMLNDLFKEKKDIYSISNDIEILDNKFYLPWQCDDINNLFNNYGTIIDRETFGIHWFNGSSISKKYSNNLDKRIEKKLEVKSNIDYFVNQIICNKDKLNLGIFIKYLGSINETKIEELKDLYNIFIFKFKNLINLDLNNKSYKNMFIYKSPNSLEDVSLIEINNFKKYYNIDLFCRIESIDFIFDKIMYIY